MRVDELSKLLQEVPGNWRVHAATGGIAFLDPQARCRGTLRNQQTHIEWSQGPTGEDFDQAWNEEREPELEKLQQHVDQWRGGKRGRP